MDLVASSKPKAVEIAVLILWLALACGLAMSVVKLGQVALPVSLIFIYSFLAFCFAVSALFVYKISRGRNWARITYLILILFGTLKALPNLIPTIEHAPFYGTLNIAVVASQLVAMTMLFTSSSNGWFKQRDS